MDFVFGGSTLEMLAQKDASDPFIVTRVPGSNCILVVKNKRYTKNLADFGFQFERVVTGGKMEDTSDWSQVEHLHLMKVGKNNVLFCAEVDAIDEQDALVEIKASNPRYWGTKVLFQMISSGSTILCHGEKYRGVLTRITTKSLSRVAKDALYSTDVRRLEQNIVDGIKKIKRELNDFRTYRINFNHNGNLFLTPETTQESVILPPKDIVLELTRKKK